MKCKECPYCVAEENKCRLPIGNPPKSVKTPREHYKWYFKRTCER